MKINTTTLKRRALNILLWSLLFLLISRVIFINIWNFDFFRKSHWLYLSNLIDKGWVISSAHDWSFIFTTLFLVPIWYIGIKISKDINWKDAIHHLKALRKSIPYAIKTGKKAHTKFKEAIKNKKPVDLPKEEPLPKKASQSEEQNAGNTSEEDENQPYEFKRDKVRNISKIDRKVNRFKDYEPKPKEKITTQIAEPEPAIAPHKDKVKTKAKKDFTPTKMSKKPDLPQKTQTTSQNQPTQNEEEPSSNFMDKINKTISQISKKDTTQKSKAKKEDQKEKTDKEETKTQSKPKEEKRSEPRGAFQLPPPPPIIFDRILSRAGFKVIENAKTGDHKIDFAGISENEIILLKMDYEKEDWMAEEQATGNKPPQWMSENDHKISPIFELTKIKETLNKKLPKDLLKNRKIIPAYCVTGGNILNAEDMMDKWDELGVKVIRFGAGGPKEIENIIEFLEVDSKTPPKDEDFNTFKKALAAN
jgi:hypothetical protein